MSNTRHKAEDDPVLHQGRYLSSPEFVQCRGISGTATAAKVDMLSSRAQRELILFLQALSLEGGGVRQLAFDIISAFPSRVGSPTMHALGMAGKRLYTAAEVTEIEEELEVPTPGDCTAEFLKRYRGDIGDLLDDAPCGGAERAAPLVKDRPPVPWQNLYARCYEQATRRLPQFLTDFCINPFIQFRAPGEADSSYSDRERMMRVPDGLRSYDFEQAEVPYFKDIVGSLFEFQRQYVEKIRKAFTETQVSRLVFRDLDDALALGKIFVIEGNARLGKSTAAAAWAQMHLGRVRLVKLNGFANKTTALRKIATALGIGSSHCHQPKDMEPRIFEMLKRTGILLIIDEAHYLFAQGQRLYSRPEMIDWFDTELYNNGLAVVLVATPQFAKCLERVEVQVGWNSDQFKGRVIRWTLLPVTASKEDLTAVARKRLAGATEACIKYAVGYALTSRRYMPALVDSIDQAAKLAEREGGSVITYAALERAIKDYVIPSELAKARTFLTPGRKGLKDTAVSARVNESRTAPANPSQRAGTTDLDWGARFPAPGVMQASASRAGVPAPAG
jgi:hypothetical protein